jgi:hypothetical protein
MKNIQEQLDQIQQRNKRVEGDKAWETSWFRRLLITAVTFVVVSWLFVTLKIENPFSNALIPTTAFLLSTLTLPFIKKWWIKNRFRN